MVGNGKPPNGNGNGSNGSRIHIPKLGEEEEEYLLEALKAGMPISRALVMVGVSSSSFYRMKEAAEDAKKGKLRGFWDKIERARASGEAAMWIRAAKGGKGSGGAMWVLERSFGHWKTERREEQHEHSGAVEITLTRLEVSEDDRRQ